MKKTPQEIAAIEKEQQRLIRAYLTNYHRNRRDPNERSKHGRIAGPFAKSTTYAAVQARRREGLTMKPLIVLLLMLGLASAAQAQVSTKLAWSIAGSTLADVQALTFAVSVDGAPRVPVVATCTGTASPFTCTTPLPALTPGGKRNIVVIASAGLLESASIPFPVSVPGVPVVTGVVP